ncbi:MAG: GMC family oxidoreductase [Actinomycetota bacterium]|nr:GMC family oxidoreductase [Actinomycetota bacterium]
MRDYIHWANLGALCEFLAQPDNRVTLADETDRHGLPVAHFSYAQCDNDRAMLTAARTQMEQILTAAGAEEVITIERYAHLVGGARMGADEATGVVDADLQSFAVPNLYITERQHPADTRRRQPGPDHHGRHRPGGRPFDQRRLTRTAPLASDLSAPIACRRLGSSRTEQPAGRPLLARTNAPLGIDNACACCRLLCSRSQDPRLLTLLKAARTCRSGPRSTDRGPDCCLPVLA